MFHQDIFPCTAEQFFELLLKDGSSFTNEYRAVRKDTNLTVLLILLLSVICSYIHECELNYCIF